MSTKQPQDIVELFNEQRLIKICAPMVRYSKLQFRNLVKMYDCDLVFTPMILADSFCKSAKARDNEFTTNMLDVPLVVQFAANTVRDFVGASYLVAPYCDGVDLNCGCPQRWAKEMNLGCEMLRNPQKIFELVRECRNAIPKMLSISVKTRIQQDIKDTVDVCRQLEHCGVSFLTIHARTVNNNVGPINEEALKLIVDSVNIPIVGNGGINSLDDCLELQRKTGVKGAMAANGILNNPQLFIGSKVPTLQCVQDWLDICYNSTLTLDSYDKTKTTIPERPHNLTFQCFHHHLVFMLEKLLLRNQRRIFNNLKTFSSVLAFIEQQFALRPRLFSRARFLESLPIKADYANRNCLYDDLKPSEKSDYLLSYDCEESDGKYFKRKLSANDDCDWSNMFLEND